MSATLAQGSQMSKPISYVLLEREIVFDREAMGAALASRHPGVAFKIVPKADNDRGALLMVLFQQVTVVLMGFAAKLPSGWEPALQRAQAQWPEAVPAGQRHRGHVVVTVMTKSEDRLLIARCMTAVIGALIAVEPACSAVLWGAVVASAPPAFATASQAAFAVESELPKSLWVSVHPFRKDANRLVFILTLGLRVFAERELELEGPATQYQRMLHIAAGLTTYLIVRGPVVRDGDTIGFSQTERIRLRHAMASTAPDLPTYFGAVS